MYFHFTIIYIQRFNTTKEDSEQEAQYPAQKNLYTIEEVECFSNLHLSHPAKSGWVLGQTGPLSMGHTALQHMARATVSVSGQHQYINTHPQKHSPHRDASALLRAYQKYTPSKKPTNVRKAAEPLSVRELSFWQIRH